MEFKEGSFILEVSQKNKICREVHSSEFIVVRYQLLVDPVISPWYKDLGGKENAIELRLTLVDCDFQLVKTRKVPLTLTLYYESKILVQSQGILRILGSSSIGETGEAIVRIRIDEVSRSHQRQNFVILIAPNTDRDPRNNDISPVFTTPIDVMSKPKSENINSGGVNRRKKKRSINNDDNSNNNNNNYPIANNDTQDFEPPLKKINGNNTFILLIILIPNSILLFLSDYSEISQQLSSSNINVNELINELTNLRKANLVVLEKSQK